MAVTHNPPGKTFELTAAADEVAMGVFVESIRLTGDGTTTAGDIILVDPVTTTLELWRTRTTGANYAEAELISNSDIKAYWPNGFRVGTFGITAGIITVRYQ